MSNYEPWTIDTRLEGLNRVREKYGLTPMCSGKPGECTVELNEEYDAYMCTRHDQWLEPACLSAAREKCACYGRPRCPSQVQSSSSS